jgi:hypothetical protein
MSVCGGGGVLTRDNLARQSLCLISLRTTIGYATWHTSSIRSCTKAVALKYVFNLRGMGAANVLEMEEEQAKVALPFFFIFAAVLFLLTVLTIGVSKLRYKDKDSEYLQLCAVSLSLVDFVSDGNVKDDMYIEENAPSSHPTFRTPFCSDVSGRRVGGSKQAAIFFAIFLRWLFCSGCGWTVQRDLVCSHIFERNQEEAPVLCMGSAAQVRRRGLQSLGRFQGQHIARPRVEAVPKLA